MTPATLADIAQQITAAIGEPLTIEECRSVSGGCINDASVINCSNGQSYFLKSHSDAAEGMFRAEADGLRAMAATKSIRVPEVVTVGLLDSGESFIVLEAIPSVGHGGHPDDFFETFGRTLAEMHRQGTSERFGFDSDNWLGSSVQLNSWSNDWSKFWIESRLAPQLKMAHDNGRSNQKLQQLGRQLLDRIENMLDVDPEPPALLHGDLWSGNYGADENGQPTIFDPACYYGHREAEFGMTKLFGGFPKAFYDAYHETWPLAEGWESVSYTHLTLPTILLV